MSVTDTSGWALDDLFAREFLELHEPWQADQVPAPSLIALNRVLARELGLDPDQLAEDTGIAILVGNAVAPGSSPIAMAYSGHQFGGFSPLLGDGRALLLGEVVTPDGARHDVHLKGSGRTPYSRGGDGKATLGPMLREFVLAEAMHALGVPTGRALSVVATGQQVARQNGPEPGAVLGRVASSHIRVGTFEFAAQQSDPELLIRLVDHSIERHHPAAASAPNRFLAFLEAVAETQASLIARWMLVGFIHGVMNTDNVTISGETIDYGPCAFLDRYDPATVFSSIDRQGRYAYRNQPAIMQWNLARLAETLVPLIDDDVDTAVEQATKVLTDYPKRYEHHWALGMAAKLGLNALSDTDGELFTDLLALLETQRADYTTTFRALAQSLSDDTALLERTLTDATSRDPWVQRWRDRLTAEGQKLADVATKMDATNPLYIPRNHLVEEALAAATAGDNTPFHTLLDAVTRPYEQRPGLERYAEPAPDTFTESFQTFCGT
jgi:uncharacterized protein YdiU (UPF0061 family)